MASVSSVGLRFLRHQVALWKSLIDFRASNERVNSECDKEKTAYPRYGALRYTARKHAPTQHRKACAQRVADNTTQRDAHPVLREALCCTSGEVRRRYADTPSCAPCLTWAAAIAMVAIWLRSPHSARNVRVNACSSGGKRRSEINQGYQGANTGSGSASLTQVHAQQQRLQRHQRTCVRMWRSLLR